MVFFIINTSIAQIIKDVKGKKLIIFNDMSQCEPKSAISDKQNLYNWRAVDFETIDSLAQYNIKGKMLMADPENNAPDITLKLNQKGWYSIFVGLFRIYPDDGIRLKLTNDKATVFVKADNAYEYIDEVFWKNAELTGQNLIIKKPFNNQGTAYIAYVKLVPLDNKEIEQIKKDAENNSNKRLIALNDGHGIFYSKKPESEEAILEDVEPYKNTDFDKLYWCVGAGGDVFTYPTSLGKVYGDNMESYPRDGDRTIAESMKILNSKGINSVKEVVGYAKENGLKIYLSLRMEAFMCHQPWDGIFNGYFYDNNPQLRCKDIDGSEIARMSFAYDAVQNFIINIFKEFASYNIHGISMLYTRGAPYLLYEEPIIKGFIAKYNINPRTLKEDDERLLNYRSEFMDNFMRKVNLTLDSISKNTGKERIKISVHGLNDYKNNHFFGLNIEKWAKEKMINEVVAYPWNGGVIDVDYYVNITKNTNCSLYVEMMPRSMPPAKYKEKAEELYKKGVYGLSFWDTNSRHPKLTQWSMIRRLGHKDELEKWDDGNGTYFKKIRLKYIGQYRVDKYPPGDCY